MRATSIRAKVLTSMSMTRVPAKTARESMRGSRREGMSSPRKAMGMDPAQRPTP
jgi:hypothetical protein